MAESSHAAEAPATAADPSWLPESLDEELARFADEMGRSVFSPRMSKNEKYAVKLLRDLTCLRKAESQEEKQQVEAAHGIPVMLELLSRAEQLTQDVVVKSSVDLLLDRISDPRWAYSDASRELAKESLDRFKEQRWGHQPTPPQPEPEPAVTSPRRRRNRRASSTVAVTYNAPVPAEDDPLFGRDGPMHGTMIKYKNEVSSNRCRGKSIILNKAVQVDCHVHGHNGLQVGQIFLRQSVAVAQGAHGSWQGGIHGADFDGVFSVVVSGTYNKLERDNLLSFEYHTTDALTNTSPNDILPTHGLTALRRSVVTGLPVRVLRGPNSKYEHAPAIGYRYDGLYTVVSERFLTNGSGGLFTAFRLNRRDNQPPVDLGRPNGLDFQHHDDLKRRLDTD